MEQLLGHDKERNKTRKHVIDTHTHAGERKSAKTRKRICGRNRIDGNLQSLCSLCYLSKEAYPKTIVCLATFPYDPSNKEMEEKSPANGVHIVVKYRAIKVHTAKLILGSFRFFYTFSVPSEKRWFDGKKAPPENRTHSTIACTAHIIRLSCVCQRKMHRRARAPMKVYMAKTNSSKKKTPKKNNAANPLCCCCVSITYQTIAPEPQHTRPTRCVHGVCAFSWVMEIRAHSTQFSPDSCFTNGKITAI